jgi:hypothetical protein
MVTLSGKNDCISSFHYCKVHVAMAFDVFISYSHKDKTTADAVCAALESAGVRCWIAPRDIRGGVEYAAAIIEGIDSSRVMVLVFSSSADASPQIHREVQHAVGKLTIIPVRIEEIAPTGAMEFYLDSVHWLDALTPPLAQHIAQLVEQVKANLQVGSGELHPPPARLVSPPLPRPPNNYPLWIATAFAALIIAAYVVWHYWPTNPGLVITRTDAFGGTGGAAFDDLKENVDQAPISSLKIVVAQNSQDIKQTVIAGLQATWGNRVGPFHGTEIGSANVVTFKKGEKVGKIDINSKSYYWPNGPSPQWISGLQIWTDSSVYPFGDVTSNPTNQCLLKYDETLLAFFGRSGQVIDQLGCIIGKPK